MNSKTYISPLDVTKCDVRGGGTQLFLMQSHNFIEIGEISVKVVLLPHEKVGSSPPKTMFYHPLITSKALFLLSEITKHGVRWKDPPHLNHVF